MSVFAPKPASAITKKRQSALFAGASFGKVQWKCPLKETMNATAKAIALAMRGSIVLASMIAVTTAAWVSVSAMPTTPKRSVMPASETSPCNNDREPKIIRAPIFFRKSA